MAETRFREDEYLVKTITHALEGVVAAATEEVVQRAVAEFEKRLRRDIATVAMSAASFYELDRDERSVVIKVNIKDNSK